MNSSFYNGISGVKSSQFGIDVWADNISNIGTTGFIGKTPEFSTYFSTAMGENHTDYTANQIGYGSKAQANTLNTFEQGEFTPTDRAFDLAIDGKGWFGVQSIESEIFYTRVGAFDIDIDGYLVDESGNYLLGTSGNNISPTTFDKEKLESLGSYYKTEEGIQELANPYSINPIYDIALGEVSEQNKIHLPDFLYLPAEPTTYINYEANLNPQVTLENVQIDLDKNDIGLYTIDPALPSITLSGTVSNTPELQNPQEGDTITLNITDEDGNDIALTTQLEKSVIDDSLNWQFDNANFSGLNLLTSLSLNAKLQTEQEIPNVEHFSTEIIAPNGEKNHVDVTYTKQVPQITSNKTWDIQFQVLKFYETYNPDTSYDTTIYKVDTGQKKVYEILDEKVGEATYDITGKLIESKIPTLTNGDSTLDINIGKPYEVQNVLFTNEVDTINNTLTISGTTSELESGDTITIDITDINGNFITTNATINDDFAWSVEYQNDILDISNALNIEAYSITNSGFDGIVSHEDITKSRYYDSDGYIEGYLNKYGMDSLGNVIAEFNNGKSSAIAKIALYHFRNEQGLSNITSTLFSKTANSGDPIFYTNENGSNYLGAGIRSNNLETSNVKYSTALTELLVMQKAFDASAKSITTSDQLIQNAINMKK